MIFTLTKSNREKEKVMGRKGNSKRKPKQIKQNPTANVSGNSPVQTLVKDKGAPVQNDNAKASGGWNKKKKKQH
jgi:hypothetical protein